MSEPVFTLIRGDAPIVISMPHIGTHIPEALRTRYVARALTVEDTDWHLERLYSFAVSLGASVLTSNISRYVIDLNRPPNDAPMYPGASNTELCPTRFFTGDALYIDGQSPTARERDARRQQYWQPYHDQLQTELNRQRQKHGAVLLWDAHSIRSEIPWLFEGKLPDLNIGTADGAAAHSSIALAVHEAASSAQAKTPHATSVVNGRFKGGFITRNYGDPANNVHAVQLEQCQSTYMQEQAPFAYDEQTAKQIAPVIQQMMQAALSALQSLSAKEKRS